MPNEGEKVKIKAKYWVMVDVKLPKLLFLQIEGNLEFSDYFNVAENTLDTNLIIVNGGLIIGEQGKPFNSLLDIVLGKDLPRETISIDNIEYPK